MKTNKNNNNHHTMKINLYNSETSQPSKTIKNKISINNDKYENTLKFDQFYKKIYKSNFNGDSPCLKRKVCSPTYSKSYENFASKKIIIQEKKKIKCSNLKCLTHNRNFKSEENFAIEEKTCFNSSTTDYCKTIIKNNNLLLSPNNVHKRVKFDLLNLKRKSTESTNVYERIKNNWVDEFFWKKINSETPLKEQKEKLIQEACNTDDNDNLKTYRVFNSEFIKKIYILSPFKQNFNKITKKLEGNTEQNHGKNQILKQCLADFSTYMFDENLEFKLKNYNYESDIFKKIMLYQQFLSESLINSKQDELAKINDIIFKMISLLYEKSH